MFELNEVLKRDSVKVGDFELSELRLINDSQFPWCILVPRRCGVAEIYQLNAEDRRRLMEESCRLAEALHDAFAADKLNIAAIGNKVSQLHLHHIVRKKTDKCWPEPVWGRIPPVPYGEIELAEILLKLRTLLEDALVFSSYEDDRVLF